jgi:Uma2 family endonuclease
MTTIQPTWGEIIEAPPTMTADDLLNLPDDGYKYELYEGVLVREMTSPSHGAICQRLGGVLFIYAQATGFPNPIVQNALFDLTPAGTSNSIVFAPDLAIMRPTGSPTWTIPHDAPLLAVEVASPQQTLARMALKAQTYLDAGVEEVWLIDYKTRAVEVWSSQGTTTLDDTATLTSPLLPGFGASVRFLLDG